MCSWAGQGRRKVPPVPRVLIGRRPEGLGAAGSSCSDAADGCRDGD